MSITRRQLLETMALTGATALLPRLAFAQAPGPNSGFPPQSTIDNDPLRPRYHLMPRRGWMNDPCAPVYFNGRYHLFFQYNPFASVWGNMSWAHAVSKDMVHWTERPVALDRTPGGPDSYGVFTGSMILDNGIPTILYTCVSPSTKEQSTLWASNPPEREAQCIATPVLAKDAHPNSAYSLDRWNKNPTPVIPTPPPGMKITGFRDPVPWREDDGNYYMLLASGQKGIGGNVLLYKSSDLKAWQYQGIFAEGKPTGKQTDDTVDSGETWECPDFFALGGKHVLIHSTGTPTGRKTLWQSGTLNKTTMKWTPEKEGVLNHGPYYAPKSQLDADGNRILWAWIPEDRPDTVFGKAGWAGCMSLPRIMTLENGEARFTPAPQVDLLRYASIEDAIKAGLPGAVEQQSETVWHLHRATAPLPPDRISSNGQPFMELASDPSRTSILFNGKEVPLDQPLPDELAVRVFLDHSLIEIFVGDRLVLTDRVYTRTPGEAATKLVLPGGFRTTLPGAFLMKAI